MQALYQFWRRKETVSKGMALIEKLMETQFGVAFRRQGTEAELSPIWDF